MRTWSLGVLSYIAFLCGPVHATLGENSTSVERDRQALQAQPAQQSQSALYQVNELKSPVNSVTEYVSPDGAVFAISWHGVSNPDLSQLLGSYYREYLVGNAAVPRNFHSRKPVTVKTSNLVMHREGHMRDMHGKVYIPARVPANVNVEDLP